MLLLFYSIRRPWKILTFKGTPMPYFNFIVFLTNPVFLLSFFLYFFLAFFGTLNTAFLLMPLKAYLPIFEILDDLNLMLFSFFFL